MHLGNKVNEIYTLSEKTYSTERLKNFGCVRIKKYFVLYTGSPSFQPSIPRIFMPYQKNTWKAVEPKSLNLVDAGYKTIARKSYKTIEDLISIGCEESCNSLNGESYYVLPSKYTSGIDIIFKKSRSGRWRATPESRRIILEGINEPFDVDSVLKKLRLKK